LNKPKRSFKPFRKIVVPVLPGVHTPAALELAKATGGTVLLVGLVTVDSEAAISAGASAARELRAAMRKLDASLPRSAVGPVHVTQQPVAELIDMIQRDPPDLLILQWPQHFDALRSLPNDFVTHNPCSLALIRGPLPKEPGSVVVPMRGGPYAELSLRLGLALPHTSLEAVNFINSTGHAIDAPLRGLDRILPNMSGVDYRRIVADDVVEGLLQESQRAGLLIMGASATGGLGRVAERMLQEANSSVIVIKSSETGPQRWTGVEGEQAGKQAISVLVDKWFAENTYHADEFNDLEHLVELKESQRLTISLALPALNEEETVGKVISTIKGELMDRFHLLDEIVLMDSNSSDRTRQIARDLGVPVYIHQQVLPEYGSRRGKGEALWKSLHVTQGDLLVWIDTDIVNIHPRFVYGIIGPMLASPNVQFVKGFYRRPLRSGGKMQAGGGGRVTELTARPLLNLFYPEISGVIQPLSGEYGGRRKALEQLCFFSGYGVEIGMLIDIFEKFGLSAIAQVDLLERIHHNQPLEALSKMSFVILQAVMSKLEKRYNRPMLEEINKTMKLVRHERGSYFLDVEEVLEQQRPPMVELPEYGGFSE
jgi:nucleotide-binding universal stress UspA family protein